MPGYKTGKTGQDRQGQTRAAPRLADADTTDTQVALIPITDREGPTREGRALSPTLSRLSRGLALALPRYWGTYCRLQAQEEGRDSCDGPTLPGTYVTNLAGAQVLIMPKKAETRHAAGELIREGDKGGRQGRPLLLPRGLCLPEELPKSHFFFPKL